MNSKMPKWAERRAQEARHRAEVAALQAKAQSWEQAYNRLLDDYIGACIEHEEAEALAELTELDAERFRLECEALDATLKQRDIDLAQAVSRANHLENVFQPDYVTPPWESLAEAIEVEKSREALLRTCLGEVLLDDLLQGRQSIDDWVAEQIGTATDTPPTFWLRRQQRYDMWALEKRLAASSTLPQEPLTENIA